MTNNTATVTHRLFDSSGRWRHEGTREECETATYGLAGWQIYSVLSNGTLGPLAAEDGPGSY